MVARCAHDSPYLILVPFSRSHAARLVRHIRIEISSSLWDNQHHHCSKLYGTDPKLRFRVPRGLPRKLEACLHRLHLHVAYTNQFLYLIGIKDSQVCDFCQVIHTVSHALCYCTQYNAERSALLNKLGIHGNQERCQQSSSARECLWVLFLCVDIC